MPDRDDDRYTTAGLTVSVFTDGAPASMAVKSLGRPRAKALPPMPREDPLDYVTEITEQLRTRSIG